ncbi:Adenylate kinase [Amphibacillus marinus]|uniref:Adenylate kinase n=1 Tax=Amphibacillus marinus TaxID=872970 RepID=A0A1H8MV22_9BACI|nr:AAA family ATPase [Amphibacillus marinus]SEO21053.1 Adenylate kinase [Amphibacillus marinus]
MKRIIILGSPGSGKSTLANKISTKLSITLHHLDKLFWRAAWQETPREEFEQQLVHILQTEEWIIDGNYNRTLPLRLAHAELVVLLDYPTWRCLWGVIKRYFTYRNKTRPDMAEGCNERLNWDFFKYVLLFRRQQLGQTEAHLAKRDRHVMLVRLQSPKAVEPFIEQLLEQLAINN